MQERGSWTEHQDELQSDVRNMCIRDIYSAKNCSHLGNPSPTHAGILGDCSRILMQGNIVYTCGFLGNRSLGALKLQGLDACKKEHCTATSCDTLSTLYVVQGVKTIIDVETTLIIRVWEKWFTLDCAQVAVKASACARKNHDITS